MADDKPVTKKDLAGVIQKVNVENALKVEITEPEKIAKPLIDIQKKNDLKTLENSIEQKSLFESMLNGLQNIGDDIKDGFSDMAQSLKQKGSNVLKFLGIALGAAAGLILAPVFAAGAFFKQLAVELKFLDKLTKGRLGKIFAPVTKFFQRIGNFFKKGFQPILKVFDNAKKTLSGVTKSGGTLGKFFGFLKKVGGVVGKVFKPLTKGFKQGFGVVTKFASTAGRVLGKLFLPITILMSVFDFVKGFMRGFSEDGIIGGLKEGIISVVDGLFGSLIRMLTVIPTKLAEWLGLDNFAFAIQTSVNDMINGFYTAFGGLVDIIVGIFTFDGEKIMTGFSDVWSGIVDIVMLPFRLLGGLLADIFGFEFIQELKEKYNIGNMIKKMFAQVKLFIADMFDWVPGLGGTLKEMKIQAQQDLIDLEAPAPSQTIVVAPSQSTPASGGGDNVSVNPTTILINDNNRALAAQRRSLRGGGNTAFAEDF